MRKEEEQKPLTFSFCLCNYHKVQGDDVLGMSLQNEKGGHDSYPEPTIPELFENTQGGFHGEAICVLPNRRWNCHCHC